MFIGNGTVNEIWTRFELQDGLLVIKTMYGSKKTEFGLPMMDFVCQKNWLFHFYRMLGTK